MKTAIIWLVIGMIIQGLWMQWRFTGTLFSNEIRQEIIDEILIKEFKEKDVFIVLKKIKIVKEFIKEIKIIIAKK